MARGSDATLAATVVWQTPSDRGHEAGAIERTKWSCLHETSEYSVDWPLVASPAKRSIMKWTIGALAILLATAAWLVLPRGELAGVVSAVPNSWDFVGPDRACTIETAAPSPRSVRVGCYAVEGQLFVHSHRWADQPPRFGTSWVAEVAKNPLVRIQIDESIYELEAHEVVDEGRRATILVPRGHEPVPAGMRLFRFSSRGLEGGRSSPLRSTKITGS